MLDSLLSELYDSGVRVVLENDKLLVQSKKGKVSKEILERIKKHKPDLIKHLWSKEYNVEFNRINRAVTKDFYSLSSAQKRLFLLQQMDLNSTAYNLPNIISLGVESDKEKIEAVFRQLIFRHESFRTSFTIEGEEPVQRIHEQVEFNLEEFKVEKGEVQHQRQQFVQAFDLSKAPLLRAAVVNINGQGSLLMIDMHHIISDGVSQAILEQDFNGLYVGETLDPLSLQYKDYSEWQNSEEQQAKVKEQEAYWVRKFEGDLPVLNLPSDYVRPVIQSNEGATVDFALSKEETQSIKTLAKENGLTLYMSLLSAFNILLSKLSGQEDVIVGMPIAGRNHTDLENIVGFFVNTLALRNEVNGNNTLKEFTKKLKQSTLEAFENQDYQFEELVENISIDRDVSRNPVFDVMFNLLNQAEYSANLTSLKEHGYIHTPGISKFDLTLTATDYGDQLLLSFEYCTRLFKAETIERFIRYFKQIVTQISQNQEIELSAIEIISEEEKQQLLYDFNDTEVDYSSQKSISQVFDEQVKQFSKEIALEDKDKSYTYQDLDEESNKIANYLIKRGVAEEQLVGLRAGRSSDMIIGILGILKTGGAYVPLDPAYPEERVKQLIEDSGINILLSTEKIDFECNLSGGVINIKDKEIKETSTDLSLPTISSSNIAYVMYTSGSTGTPKGVVIEQKSVLRLVQNNQFFPFHSEQKILLTGAPVFDATTFEIWGALLNGGSLYVASNEVIINSELLGECIRENSITSLWLTSSLFNQLIDQEESIFDTLKYLLVGGDVLSVKYINKIRSRNSELVIINGYGPTENTTFSTTFNIEKEYKSNIPIGKPISNSTAYIFDKSNKLQAIGVSGELLLGGDGLAREYLNNPELTSEKFIENPYKKGERLYRTGDLARWLPDGNIEFLGRIDHQVKIRGFRIELGEIENVLIKHSSIKECVVLAREENGDKYICAYLVTEQNYNLEEIRTYLLASLPDYMIPSYFVELDSLPLTTNGKVNRKALQIPEIKAGDDYVAPSGATEEKLVEIWSQVLNIEKEEISTTADFFAMGGHSLKASVLTGKIHKELGVEFPLRNVFLHSCIKAQADQVEKSTRKDFVSIPKAKEQEYYTLSSSQRRLYLLQQMDLESTAYNMPYIIPLGAGVDKDKIEEVFLQLISRHESFRTSFEIINEEPVQRIHKQVEFKLEEISIEKDEVQEKRQQFIQPFDLLRAPLLRISKVNIKGEGSLLMIDMHHIISDGVSQAILEQDFNRLYAGETLTPLDLQYKDYSEWQNSKEQRQKKQDQEQYWLNKFGGEIPVLNLPTDYVRPVMQSTEGATVSFVLSKWETRQIKSLAEENDLTLYMSILSVFNILLSKLSGQEDIVIGTPIAGRNHSDLENIVGMFINTLAIRNDVNGNNTLKEFTRNLKQSTLKAFENKDYQFEDLVEQVSVERDMSRNPVFDVMFNLLNQIEHTGNLSSLDSNIYLHKPSISKFDLTLTGVDYGDQLMLNFEYCIKLYKAETIERFIKYFKRIVSQITNSLQKNISDLEIMDQEEKQQLLYEFNNTKIDYPKDKTIHQLIKEQGEKKPQKVAVYCNGESISYKELSNKSSRLASYIFNLAGDNSIIGIMVDRSIEMVIGILAVMKSGNVYLPLDISHPKDRNHKILKESDVTIVLSDNKDIQVDNINVVNLLDSEVYQNELDLESKNTKSTNPAYVIYTSGSTGVPKGVMVTHRNVVNLIYGMTGLIPDNTPGSMLSLTTISFDIFGLELYAPLLNGFSMVLANDGDQYSVEKIASIVKNQDVKILQLTPSRLALILADEYCKDIFSEIEVLLVGGEELPETLLSNLRDLYKGKVYNMYGPTETTIWSTFKDVSGELPLNIGKPIYNTQVYILGLQDELKPIGVSGELCISGDGLAIGYLNNPRLTREKFIENPYKQGELLYKTGDLARWLPDGNIEFLGRLDQQVKLRGYRIELGEIESALLNLKEVKNVVVIDSISKTGEKYLCAYLIFEDKLTFEELRSHLTGLLPDYMIPSYFVEIEEFPLTSNGKLNRKALPLPNLKIGDNYVAALGPLEEHLVEIWEEVLNIKPISVTDNFYKIGGNSLLAITLLNKIEKKLGERIQFSAFLQNLTIRDLSAFINKLFSWSEGGYQLDDSVNKSQDLINTVKIANLQTKGENLPIFFVAPLGGILPATSIIGIMDLPLLLGENQPFYSVQASPLFPDLAQAISVAGELNLSDYNFKEDIFQKYVQDCIQAIKKIYNGEELYIGGFCTGCILAMELAAQIEKSGFNVKELFLIDPPLTILTNKEFSEISKLNFNMEELAWFIAKDIGWKEKIDLQDVTNSLKSANNEEIWEVGVNILRSHKTIDKLTTSKDLKISYYTKFYNQELITTYLSKINYNYPRVEVEKASLIFAGMDEVVNNKRFVELVSKYFKNTIAIENISGDHGSVFLQPNINKLVEYINRNVNSY